VFALLAAFDATGAETGFTIFQYGLGHQMATMIGGATANMDLSRAGEIKPVKVPGSEGKVEANVSFAPIDGKPAGTVETTRSINFLLLEENSKASITGSICPAPDGKVEFTIKLGYKGRAGSGGSMIYDKNLEARVVANVGEDANIVNADFEVKQGTRSTTGGRQAYVESSASYQVPRGDLSDKGVTASRIKFIRASSQAILADAEAARDDILRAVSMGNGALTGAREHWQSGNCIKLYATSPGRVSSGATSRIPVAVNHMKDQSSVPAKVTVALSGGKSVDPAVIPKAPGDLTHVAPNDRKARMKITLTATSRRGKDKLELDLSIGGQAYSATGGAGDFHGTGTICDIAAPFTIEGGGNVVKFVPTSEKGGSYTYAGNMSGFGVFGNGTYTVKYEGEAPVGITATGPGSVKTPMGTHTKVDTERYKLSPSSATCGG
jgi:hypothetical protein